MWKTLKKKPLVTIQNAHSAKGPNSSCGDGENWITAVAALINSDLVASGGFYGNLILTLFLNDTFVKETNYNFCCLVAGSKDGCVRFWQCSRDYKSLTPLFSVPVVSIRFLILEY